MTNHQNLLIAATAVQVLVVAVVFAFAERVPWLSLIVLVALSVSWQNLWRRAPGS